MNNWRLPTAFNGCTCECHTVPMLHMMACCSPNTVRELIDECEQRQIDANLRAHQLSIPPVAEVVYDMTLQIEAADRVLAKLVAMTDEELIQCLDECEDGAVAYALDGMVMRLT